MIQLPLFLHFDDPSALGPFTFTLPFSPGEITSAPRLELSLSNQVISLETKVLARWPKDQSIRSLLVRGVTENINHKEGTLSIYKDEGIENPTLKALPDGPIFAHLSAEHYARSLICGPQLPKSQNQDFKAWESLLDHYVEGMQPEWRSYGLSSKVTALERSYYDSPFALYQRFIRDPSPETFNRAREEAQWYRQQELRWEEEGEIAVFNYPFTWDRNTPMPWSVIRRITLQGMLCDYLLSGDEEALNALEGMAQAFRANFKALTSGQEITVLVTERNMGWTIMGLACSYALFQSEEDLERLKILIGLCETWQNQGSSGAFEHDLHRPDPSECGYGPNGASPFMTAILCDSLYLTYTLTEDQRLPKMILRVAEWLKNDTFTRNGKAFQYLWGCQDRDYHIENPDMVFLNLLIVPVFGYAYVLSQDPNWIKLGDRLAHLGVESGAIHTPKQWTQAMRGFAQYLGIRSGVKI